MIALMLDYLRDISAEALCMLSEFLIQISYRDFLIPCGLPYSWKRKTSFFGFVRFGFVCDDRVDHNDIRQSCSDYYDLLSIADHICSHADTALPVGMQRILKILSETGVT